MPHDASNEGVPPLGLGGVWVPFPTAHAVGYAPMALTLLTRSVSEGDDKRRFPWFPSLTLRVTGVKSVPLGYDLPPSGLTAC